MKKQKVLTLKVLLLFVLFSVGIIAFKPSAVYADSQTINTNGKTFIVVSDYNSGTTLYQKVSGYYKQVARTSKFGRYIFSYGKSYIFQEVVKGDLVILLHTPSERRDLNLKKKFI